MNDLSNLSKAICEINENEAETLVTQMINAGVPAIDILSQCQQGMTELGKRFEEGDCFIPELVVAGKIMEKMTQKLEPLLKQSREASPQTGCVVMGTVQNDVHNIGKDIVVMMLKGAGHRVVDLGVNVPPAQFVEAVKNHNADAIGMSVLITSCYKAIPATVEAIQNAGLKDQVSIMLGGAAATQMLAEKTGCDFYGRTPADVLKHMSDILVKRVNPN